MAECSPTELMADAKCFMCLDATQTNAVIAALLCQILQASDPMATCDPTELMEAGKCFLCLDDRAMKAVQLQLLCEILDAGGGGGGTGTGVACGVVNPTIDPGVACQMYYNTANSTLWSWNDVSGAWESLII